MTYHRICKQINTTDVTSGAGTDNRSGAHEFTPSFQWGSCYSIFSFIYMLRDRCLSICTFSFGHCVVCPSSIYGFWLPPWYLQTIGHCSLSLFDVRILIPFGIFTLSTVVLSDFFDVCILVTPLESSTFWPLQYVLCYPDFDYAFGFFKLLAIVVCPSLIYEF